MTDLTGHDYMQNQEYKNSPTDCTIQLRKLWEINDIWSSSNICENEFYRFVTGDATNVQCAETLLRRRQALHIEKFQQHQLW